MLSIAVCDDEVIECCSMAKRIKEIMGEMKVPCIIRQFQSGRELLKPVDHRKLKSVLQKAVLKTERRSQEFIVVSRERQKRKMFLDDIYYFEIKGRVVAVHGAEGVFTYYERIGELEDKLGGKGFFRCHKSYLINLKYVDGYNRQEAILENGEKIVIAKRRYDRFVREVLVVMRKNGGII